MKFSRKNAGAGCAGPVACLQILTLLLLLALVPAIAGADGMTTDPDKAPPGNNETGSWPPAGAASTGPVVPDGFAGVWYAFVDNTAFTLVIEQNGQKLRVAHTAVYDYGRRVDSSVGGVSMSGTVSGSLAYLEWKSGLSPEQGRATLEYLPGRPVTLHWKIVDMPKKEDDRSDAGNTAEVGYFLPASAFLIRK